MTKSYQQRKLEELVDILSVKGRNKPDFNEIKSELINKLGPVHWERLFRRAQVKSVQREINVKD